MESSRPKRAGLVLTALILVAAVANLNLAVANVALPDIGKAFGSGQTTLNLIAVGYSLGLATSVLYLGALGVYYGPFDEDYGYVTLEGFAAHRPVVTLTDAGGPLEFVTDGETGLVTPPEPQAIAHAFDRLFSNRPLAKKMGEAGNEKLRATVPGWPEVVARLTE